MRVTHTRARTHTCTHSHTCAHNTPLSPAPPPPPLLLLQVPLQPLIRTTTFDCHHHNCHVRTTASSTLTAVSDPCGRRRGRVSRPRCPFGLAVKQTVYGDRQREYRLLFSTPHATNVCTLHWIPTRPLSHSAICHTTCHKRLHIQLDPCPSTHALSHTTCYEARAHLVSPSTA